jgi:hypothetical protein
MKVTGMVWWALGGGSAGSLLGAWLMACGGPSFSAGPSDAAADGTPTDSGSPDAAADGTLIESASPDAAPTLCPTPPCMLASGQRAPIAVVIDYAEVFWANEGTSPNYIDGNLSKYSLTTGMMSPLIQTIGPVSIDLLLGEVHWLSADGPSVGIVSGSGGSPGRTNLPLGQPEDLVVDTSTVYVSLAVPLADGGVGGALVTVPLSTNEAMVTPFLPTPLVAPRIALDLNNVYWTEVDFRSPAGLLTGGSVWQASKMNPVPAPLAQGEPSPYALAVDSDYVYFSTALSNVNPKGGLIKRVSITNPKVPTILAQTSLPALALTTDHDNLYWAEYGQSSSIFQMAKTGPTAQVITLAQSQAYPRGIAVWNGIVTWVNGGTGTKPDGGTDLVFDKQDGTVWAMPVHP